MVKRNTPTSSSPAPSPYTDLLTAAWEGRIPLLELFNHANDLAEKQQLHLAAVLYQTWLRRNRTTHDHLAYFNYGVVLFSLNDFLGAIEAYTRALHLSPQFLQPRFNLGLTYERLGQSDAAVEQWLHMERHANSQDPEQRTLLLMALNNLGRHLEERGRLAESLSYLDKSLTVEPNQPDVIHHWVFLRAKQCLWPVYEERTGLDDVLLKRHTSALAMISLSEDPVDQLAAAQRFVKEKVRTQVPSLAPKKPYGHRKLRIGYCSSDLCMHPVAMLTVELFELHDKERFELYAFDWSREDGSAMRQRVIAAMDHFHRIHALTDEQAAQLIRSCEIDILIDLQGQTLGARPNMLAYRPAPVQITYLGLPATTGLPFIDYVIADRFLIPEGAQGHYTEKPLYLPDVYQVSDRQRLASVPPARSDCGLPEQAFVFCCFNNNYKITPEVFATWMRILQRTPGSVLWLLADNPAARVHLREQAMLAGQDPDRLVFATRAQPADYLARYAVADLFLDTYPFNAGTTANDALWMGLPVLTRSGQTFASRMAGALLTAAGLPQFITASADAYEDRAVELFHDRESLMAARSQLAIQKATGPLFDTPRLVKQLEAAVVSVLPK